MSYNLLGEIQSENTNSKAFNSVSLQVLYSFVCNFSHEDISLSFKDANEEIS